MPIIFTLTPIYIYMEYDNRNFERHCRDALVMERLSSSHHPASIYGYCANTVLTQAISHTLDDVIYAHENEEVAKWLPRSGYVTRPPLELWMGMNDEGEPLATRETKLGGSFGIGGIPWVKRFARGRWYYQ